MTQTLAIRSAQDSDLEAVLALYRHLIPDDPPVLPDQARAAFNRLLLYPGSAILLGYADTTLLTTCTLVVIPNLTHAATSYALIENVVTHADHRGQGHGKAILKAATDQAWAQGCYKVMLSTSSRNPNTLAFYAAAGFEQSRTGFQIRRPPARLP